jgi:hypothetical protein
MLRLPDRELLPRKTTNILFGLIPSPPVVRPHPPLGGLVGQRIGVLPRATPEMVDWTKGITDWGKMGNDQVSDCTLACMAHLVECWSGVTQTRFIIPEEVVLEEYERLTGYSRATGNPAESPGMQIETGLDFFAQHGFLEHKCYFFRRSLNVANGVYGRKLLCDAIFQLGGVIVSLHFPGTAVSDAYNYGEPWRANMGTPDTYHCIPLVAFDSEYFEAITWGGLQRMDFPFLQQYCVEIWGAAGEDWLFNNQNPIQRNRTQLRDDLEWLMVFGQLLAD